MFLNFVYQVQMIFNWPSRNTFDNTELQFMILLTKRWRLRVLFCRRKIILTLTMAVTRWAGNYVSHGENIFTILQQQLGHWNTTTTTISSALSLLKITFLLPRKCTFGSKCVWNIKKWFHAASIQFCGKFEMVMLVRWCRVEEWRWQFWFLISATCRSWS